MTRRRAELVDSTVLIDLIDIPHEALDHEVRLREVQEKVDAGISLYLPVATVIETGQHIQRLGEGHGAARRRCALSLEKVLTATLDGTAPWAFSPVHWQSVLADLISPPAPYPGGLVEALGGQRLDMGDLCILAELRQLRTNLGAHVLVGVWTRDAGLRNAVDCL